MSLPKVCAIDDCDRRVIARGWCQLHWSRWQRHGDPEKVIRPASPEARFRAQYAVDPKTGCWEWAGYRHPGKWNYGTLMVGGKSMRAHRWSYEQFVGPIPDGFVVDHLCRNPPCVNPEHLEAVTTRVNTIERGMGYRAITYREGRCKRGHVLTPENVYSPPKTPTIRQCRPCRHLADQRRRSKESA